MSDVTCPVEHRELVRRKTFAVGEMTPDEAVFDLELLDHDFYLFKSRETGEDNVDVRSEGAGYEPFETARRARSRRPQRRSGTARAGHRR